LYTSFTIEKADVLEGCDWYLLLIRSRGYRVADATVDARNEEEKIERIESIF
jgi:hypothetical protein